MLRNMKIGLRMGLGFGVVLLLMIGMGLFALNRLGTMNAGTNILVKDRWPKTVESNAIEKLLDEEVISLSLAVLQDDAGEVKKTLNAVADMRREATGKFDELARTISTEEGKAALKAVVDVRSSYGGTLDEVVRLVESGDKVQSKAIFCGKLRLLQVEYSKAVANLVKVVAKLVDRAGTEAEESYLTSRTMISIVLGGSVALAVLIVLLLTRSIAKPLSEAVAINRKLADGDLSVVVDSGRGDEIGQLFEAMKNMVDRLRQIMSDINMLTDAAVNGKLSTRADASRYAGDYQKIVQGINETLHAVISPLNISAEYVDRISKGDIPPKITDEYKGDFNEIKNNLNVLIDAMDAVTDASKAIAVGDLSVKITERSSKDELMRALSAMVGGLNEVGFIATELAAGNLAVKVKARSDKDTMMLSLSKMVSDLTEIVTSIQGVADQVMAGSEELSASAETLSQGATEQVRSC